MFLSVEDDETMIVLGDFNEDILTDRNGVLMQFMCNNGFDQCVYSATTDRGTLIDLVFYRSMKFMVYSVGTCDTYYSDHDAVYTVMNFNE